jgi:hypothetical protein
VGRDPVIYGEITAEELSLLINVPIRSTLERGHKTATSSVFSCGLAPGHLFLSSFMFCHLTAYPLNHVKHGCKVKVKISLFEAVEAHRVARG